MTKFGVSPAFFFSRHTTNYSADEFRSSLHAVRALGFAAFQPEIYKREKVAEWLSGGGVQIIGLAKELDLHVSQFVAHFLMHGFSSRARLADHSDLEVLQPVAEVAARFPGCGVLTIPVARFELDGTPVSHAELWERMRDKVAACLAISRAAGLRLALEILPYSLLTNADGFLRLAAEIGSPDLGVNLDTGHAWSQREVMGLLPSKLHGRVFGVHLKDNNSDVNLPLAPGKGTIPWAPLLRGLRAAGYAGSWDIEIGCAPECVEAEYLEGFKFLRALNIN